MSPSFLVKIMYYTYMSFTSKMTSSVHVRADHNRILQPFLYIQNPSEAVLASIL